MIGFKMYSPCCRWYLEIRTDCGEVARLIEGLFGGFLVSEKPHREDIEALHVLIIKEGDGYLMMGRNKTYTIKNLPSVGFYIYAVIDKLIEGHMDDRFCVFHGGVIARDGAALCILAPTMTGKSTMIAHFSLNGYDYLADDYIFIDRSRKTICPVPMPVALRSTAFLGDSLNGHFLTSGFNELRGEDITLLNLFDEESQNGCEYIAQNVLLIHRTDENKLLEMSRGETYKELLFNMKRAVDFERDARAIGGYANEFSGYRLLYSSFAYAAECLEQILF
ncbi:MAG: hypothetical protein IJ009_06590 [Clostridia bacterium]|nr:hypothetical protein [Clostridia bacterium]